MSHRSLVLNTIEHMCGVMLKMTPMTAFAKQTETNIDFCCVRFKSVDILCRWMHESVNANIFGERLQFIRGSRRSGGLLRQLKRTHIHTRCLVLSVVALGWLIVIATNFKAFCWVNLIWKLTYRRLHGFWCCRTKSNPAFRFATKLVQESSILLL